MTSLATLFLSAWAATLPKYGHWQPGAYLKKLNMRVALSRRSYRLHIPQNRTSGEKLPLVIVLHGAFSTAEEIEEQSGFSDLADREGFLVAYPNGAYGIFGYLQHWNAGFCCGRAAEKRTDDVGFIDSLIADIRRMLPLDEDRLYITGFSNGGMLSYRYAAERSGRLAAASCLGGSAGSRLSARDEWQTIPQPLSPLPMIVFHAMDDANVPYKGGQTRRHNSEREYLPVMQSVNFWLKCNECDSIPASEWLATGNVKMEKWGNLRNPDQVRLYSIAYWGHRWPGNFFSSNLPDNDPMKNFDAAEIIWDFFKSRRRSDRK
jgi:polyhydroxybutyrate depolymerase